MDEGIKKRLIGATVLVSLLVIFVPMLLQREPVLEQGITSSNIPPAPDIDFRSRVIPEPTEPLSTPPKEIARIRPGERPPSLDKRTPGADQFTPAETPVQPRVGLTAWTVQVGSFSDRGNADRLVNRLREKGFSADIEQVSIGGKVLFRVLVGPEVDRRQAEQMLARLNAELQDLNLQGKLRTYP